MHRKLNNKRMKDLQMNGNKLASSSYKGLRHQVANDDSIEFPDIVAAGIERDSK